MNLYLDKAIEPRSAEVLLHIAWAGGCAFSDKASAHVFFDLDKALYLLVRKKYAKQK